MPSKHDNEADFFWVHGWMTFFHFALQIRIDFETFDISPPDFRGQCSTDFFLVTGGSPVPTLCGTNTGQHGDNQLFNSSLIFDILIGLTF